MQSLAFCFVVVAAVTTAAAVGVEGAYFLT